MLFKKIYVCINKKKIDEFKVCINAPYLLLINLVYFINYLYNYIYIYIII